MTRRGFLGSVGATGLATAARTENTEESEDNDVALRFSWGNDPEAGGARVLNVAIISRHPRQLSRPEPTQPESEQSDPQEADADADLDADLGEDVEIRTGAEEQEEEESPQEQPTAWVWRIRPEALGPDAKFVLRVTGSRQRPRYRLRVTDVSYGRLRSTTLSREIVFDFQLRDKPGSDGGKRFYLSGETTVWSGASSPMQPTTSRLRQQPAADAAASSSGVEFRTFLENNVALWTELHVNQVVNTTVLMFNGLLSRFRDTAWDRVDVTLDAGLRWTVTPRTRSLAAFGGRIALQNLRVYWPIQRGASDGLERQAPLYGDARIRTDGPDEARHVRIGGSGRGPAFDARWEPAGASDEPRIYLRMQPPRNAEGEITSNARLVGEAYMEARWRGLAFDGGQSSRRASGFPPLRGSLLERVEADRAPSNSNPARAAGTISFQARYLPADTSDTAAGGSTALETAIGRLTVVGIRDTAAEEQAPEAGTASTRFPKRRGFPITALFGWRRAQGPTRRAPETQMIEAEVGLQEAGVALPGAEYSRLSFDTTALRVFWTAAPLEERPLGSFLDLAARQGREIARLDLARARLRASRTTSLLALTFRFSDMALSFRGADVEFVRYNTSCEITTRPGRDGRLQPYDTRPIMVVEFPPQHVFEEARFTQTAPPLPDVRLASTLTLDRMSGTLTAARYTNGTPPQYAQSETTVIFDSDNLAHAADALAAISCAYEGRTTMRKTLRAWKCGNYNEGDASNDAKDNFEEADTDDARKTFAAFLKKLKLGGFPSSAPADQKIYFGPLGMDVDVRHWVRAQNVLFWQEAAGAVVARLLAAASAEYRKFTAPTSLDEALERAGWTEAVVPAYQGFRTHYRDLMVALVLAPQSSEAAKFGLTGDAVPMTLDAGEAEHFPLPDAPNDGWLPADRLGILRRREAEVARLYAASLFQNDPLNGPSRARLANPSRLAFRIRCRDGLDAERARTENGRPVYDLDQPEDAEARLPRDELDFSLDALTRFRGMELSVTARAEVIYEPGQLGQIGPRRPRVADTSVDAMLERLDFPMGQENSVRDRLAHVAASLAPPTDLQTAIEIPARVVLSPNQNAVVTTPQAAFDGAFDHDPYAGETTRVPEAIRTRAAEPLWQAEFVTEVDGLGLNPGLRAVYSPDLRPGALLSRFADRARGNGPTVPHAEPPGGPFAPWHLSLLQAQATGMTEAEIAALTHIVGSETEFSEAEREVCAPNVPRPGIVRRFCEFLAWRTAPGWEKEARFRAAIDARARHQIVLLSSAWGLPVVGRRGASGALQSDSSQFEPSERLRLWDVMPGSAIYNPRTLDVTELSLTSIGGTLRHDTGFQPPLAAKFWRDNDGVFDSLALEKWHQWTTLGRDVFTEIVYKGYLYPLGIRASLVQVTERIIYMHQETGAISAPLRQRMFIRVANPEKLYPALKQPFGGRRFPVQRLNLLTTVTPDIVDPNDGEARAGEPVAPSGRVSLDNGKGLVFWPRIFRALPGNIRFEMDLDGVKSDLPLIFVDNTAIGDAATMKSLETYYLNVASPDDTGAEKVDPIEHVRTLILGGAERRYAEEIEAGSATFRTDHWTLGASGLARLPTERIPDQNGARFIRFKLDNSDYATTPLLEGADQPPFYPLIEHARLRLTQAERLTAGSLGPVRAAFDARYLQHGFADDLAETEAAASDDGQQITTPTVPIAENPNELVLVLRDQPQLSMGDKGDQSGGVFRPSGRIVALSRKKGAMTYEGPIALQINAREIATLAPAFGPMLTGVGTQTSPTGSGALVQEPLATQPGTSDLDRTLQQLRDIYTKLFSDDAKLLGLVKIKELIAFIQRLESPNEGMPDLSEQIEFGAGVLDGVDDATAAVRENVVKPLAGAVRRIRDSWNQIEANLAAAQSGLTGTPVRPITIREIFPELDIALSNLGRALARAEGETDTVLFALELGACYSSGQQFLNALQRAASNPGQRVEDALVARYNAVLQLFRVLEAQFDTLLGRLVDEVFDGVVNTLQDALNQISEPVLMALQQAARGALNAGNTPLGPGLRELLPLPRPDVGEGVLEPGSTFAECLDCLLPPMEDVEAVFRALGDWLMQEQQIRRIIDGGLDDPEKLLRAFLDDTTVTVEFQSKDGEFGKLLEGSKKDVEDAVANVIAGIIAKAGGLPDDLKQAFKDQLEDIGDLIVTDTSGFYDYDAVSDILKLRGGTVAEQIRNRYVLCLLYNLFKKDQNELDCLPELIDLDETWPRGLIDFLGRITGPDVSGILMPDLTGLLDPVLRLVDRLARLLTALLDGNIPDLLTWLAELLSGLGLPELPGGDLCKAIDPIWDAATTVMEGVAELSAGINPLPDNWAGPTCPLAGKLSGLAPPTDTSLIGTLLTLRIYADRAQDSYTATVKAPADELLDALLKVYGDLRDGDPVKDAIDDVIKQLNGSLTFTNDCLVDFSSKSGAAYCEVLQAGREIANFRRTLKYAAGLELCNGSGLNALDLEKLQALATLPRDVQALVARREQLQRALFDLAGFAAKKVEKIRTEIDKGDALLLLPLIFTGVDLVEPFDKVAEAEQAGADVGDYTKALEDLRKALDESEVIGDAKRLVDVLLRLVCDVLDHASVLLADLTELIAGAKEKIDEVRTTAATVGVLGTEARQLIAELETAIDLDRVAAEIGRVAAEIDTARRLTSETGLCQPETLTLPDGTEISVATVRRDDGGKGLDEVVTALERELLETARKRAAEVSKTLAILPDAFRRRLEGGARHVALGTCAPPRRGLQSERDSERFVQRRRARLAPHDLQGRLRRAEPRL